MIMRQYDGRTANYQLLVTSNVDYCSLSGGVIAQQITDNTGKQGVPVWNLRAYKFIDLERQPFQRWVLRDVGELHWDDPEKGCTGSQYEDGKIDQTTGELIGLPDEFVTNFSHPGYMQLIGITYNCTTKQYIGPCV